MTPRNQKRGDDPNSIAFRVVQHATGQTPPPPDDGKNPAAVSLGRLGGLKGGKARAKKLSKERRAEIAQKAAKKRWKGHKKTKRKPA